MWLELLNKRLSIYRQLLLLHCFYICSIWTINTFNTLYYFFPEGNFIIVYPEDLQDIWLNVLPQGFLEISKGATAI